MDRSNAFKRMKGDLAYGMPATDYKRQNSMKIIRNPSKWGSRKQSQKARKPVPKLSLEADFPTLGETATQKTKATVLDYKNINKVAEKAEEDEENEEEDEIASGWGVIKKEKNKIKYLWGKTDEKENQVDNSKNSKLIARFFKNLDERIHIYEMEDFIIHGPKYINGWEYDEVMLQQHLDEKFEAELEEELYGNSAITDDSEGHSDTEFYEFV
jgi:hypothetical protein